MQGRVITSMKSNKSDALILPGPPAPFALIAGPAMRRTSADELERTMRHMGLRPERIDGDDPATVPPRFRLHLGDLSLIAGPAAETSLDRWDPAHPSTSLLATSLPRDWRAAGHCWMFVPEAVLARRCQSSGPVRARDLYKAMAMLVDLFDASHIFWSPALLWSDAPQFRASIAEMLTSGMPPVLHLVAFRRRDGEAGETVGTRGLALFAGQELEARIPVGWTVAEVVKRLARLALDMILNGPFESDQDMDGLLPGERVRLSRAVDGDRSTMRVEFGSDR